MSVGHRHASICQKKKKKKKKKEKEKKKRKKEKKQKMTVTNDIDCDDFVIMVTFSALSIQKENLANIPVYRCKVPVVTNTGG